jgi:hypothetical protein
MSKGYRELGLLMIEELERQASARRPPYGVPDTYEVPHNIQGRNLSRDLMLHEQCDYGTENARDWRF